MERFLSPVVSFGFVMALVLGPGFFFVVWFRWRRRNKRSPICRDILRGPGESLRKELARLDEQINDQILDLVVIPIFAAVAVLFPAYIKGGIPGQADYLLFLIVYIIIFPIPLLRFTRKIRERAGYRLGLDAELAVGRELNLIMREGFYVFHDFPEDHNNIDHVVVGPSGVFAVETKGRAKPDKGRGGVDAKVTYNGEALYFPDSPKETAYIHQARKQAASLSKWLSRAVGESVKVKAALALPGWFVERKKADDLIILYGKSENYARTLKGQEVLSETMIKRIVHQLEGKCRDVEPLAYNDNNKRK